MPSTEPTQLRVAQAYSALYPYPLTVKAGDILRLGVCDEEYPGWVLATSSDGKSGWCPEEYLDAVGNSGTARRDYTSRELSVSEGERVALVERVAGWGWVAAGPGREGWVPLRHLDCGGG